MRAQQCSCIPSQMSNPEKFKHLDEEGGHAETLDPAALRRRYITVAGFIGILVVLVFGIVLATRQGEVRPNVIIFYADGLGMAHVTLARAAANRSFTFGSALAGSLMTYSANSWISDLASGSTAIACGKDTNNSLVGVYVTGDNKAVPCGTLLEAALHEGAAVGVVTNGLFTSPVVASWLAHSLNMNDAAFLSRQILAKGENSDGKGLDLIFGGGKVNADPAYIQQFGWHSVDIEDVTRNETKKDEKFDFPALGLFASARLDYAIDRDSKLERHGQCLEGEKCPTLAQMTKAALERLSKSPKVTHNKKGFALVVYSAQLGRTSRDNDAAAVYRELLDLDDAVKEAKIFASEEGNEETLVIVVSPYESGGLVFGRDNSLDSDPEKIPTIDLSIKTMTVLLSQMQTQNVSWDARYTVLEQIGLNDLTDAEKRVVRGDGKPRSPDDFSLALRTILNTRFRIQWTSAGQTGTDTPLYAFGHGAEYLKGSMNNTMFGRRIAEALVLDLDTATKRAVKEYTDQLQ